VELTPSLDVHPDTGYPVKDMSPEVNRAWFEYYMPMTPERRLEVGVAMLAAMKRMILASMPEGLTEQERKRGLYESLYGEPLPHDCPV
jgi:hypothetical protein